MKIAIQVHPTRGKEVIQLLESLGGINSLKQTGRCIGCLYVDTVGIISSFGTCRHCGNRKIYTLEEFKKEFPFKIGDKVKHITSVGTIKEYCYIDNEPAYKVKSIELGIIATIPVKILEPYKEMEKRNITLTLDKAKEWYKKGGELKEIALQAFTEKELNPLPRSWEEFCEKYPVKTSEAVICTESTIVTCDYSEIRDSDCDREICPSQKSAEAHLALIQLEQLRDCWRQGWKPDWLDGNTKKYAIKGWRDKISIETTYVTHAFLSFPTYELALEFQECFKDLIEKAGDLI